MQQEWEQEREHGRGEGCRVVVGGLPGEEAALGHLWWWVC